jgi:hypothetical protein
VSESNELVHAAGTTRQYALSEEIVEAVGLRDLESICLKAHCAQGGLTDRTRRPLSDVVPLGRPPHSLLPIRGEQLELRPDRSQRRLILTGLDESRQQIEVERNPREFAQSGGSPL